MTTPKNHKLVSTMLIIGLVIVLLSYLAHPDVGQFKVFINGEPATWPWFQLAIIPTVLIVFSIIGIFSLLVFLGLGMLLFLIGLFIALLGIGLIAPYLWPILAIIFLIVALMAPDHRN